MTIPIARSRFLLTRISQFHTVTVRCCYCLSLKFTEIHVTKCFDVDMWSVGEPLKWADNDTWSVVSARDREREGALHTPGQYWRDDGRGMRRERSGRRHDKTVPWWIPDRQSYDERGAVILASVWSLSRVPYLNPRVWVGTDWRY